MNRQFISGRGIPLGKDRVDTDQIIPARFCYNTKRTGHEDSLFGNWREDPEFILNDNRFKGANILIAGREFGIGSSREYAVWALKNYGIDVIIATSFGDIFYKNAILNDLLLLIVTEDQINLLFNCVKAIPQTALFINIENNIITFKEYACNFDIEDYFKEKFIIKRNDLSVTFSHEAKIRQYELKRNSRLPNTFS